MSFNFTVKEFILGNGTGTPTLQFYKRGFNLQGNGSSPTWRDIILHGNTALTLVNAKVGSLEYLKLFGDTEQLPETYLDTVTLSGGCEQRNLPVGYTQLEYLESSGTQYIDTGVIPDDETGIKLTASFPDTTSDIFRFGCRQETTGDNRFIIGTSSGAVYFGFGQAFSDVISWVLSPNTKGDCYLNYYNNRDVSLNLNSPRALNTLTVTFTRSLIIFGRDVDGTISSSAQTIYGCEITQGNTLIHNFVPARRNSDSVLGMYDTVTGTFFTNAGTGTFTAGADVTVPSPEYPINIISNNGAIKVNRNLYSTEYHNKVLSQQDGVTTTAGPGINISGKVDCRTIKSFMVTTANPTGTYRLFKYRPDGTYIDAQITSNIGQVLVLPSDCGYFRIQYNYTSGNVGTENILIYNSAYNLGIYTDGTQEVVTDGSGNTANAERLLAVGTYKDTQEVISGSVIRNVGIKVLDGTETISKMTNASSPLGYYFAVEDTDISHIQGSTGVKIPTYCTHFENVENIVANLNNGTMTIAVAGNRFYMAYADTTTVEGFAQFLADQFANGTPVVIVYPLATATTESVSGQLLQKSPVTQTAGSISNLPIAITESQKTVPTPQQPLQINCNNGVLKVSPNLFNKNATYLNAFVNADTGVLTGANVGQRSFCVACQPNTTYVISGYGASTWGAFTDNTIGTTATSRASGNNSTITTGVNDKYLIGLAYVVDKPTDYRDTLQLEKGSTATSYMGYGQIYVDSKSKNLFNKDNALLNTSVTMDGNFISDNNYNCSNYISVQYGKTYIRSNNGTPFGVRYHLYDSNKNWLGYTDATITGLVVVSNSSAKYIAFAINKTIDLANVQLELGSTATTYEPYWDTTETVQITGKNLFDSSNSVLGYRLTSNLDGEYGSTGGGGNRFDFIAESNQFVSNLIPVEVGKTYVKNSPLANVYHRFKVYNANRVSVRISSDNSITIQSGEAYIAFCGLQAELNTAYCGEVTYTATAENLFKVGDYQDVQSVIDGGVTRNVGIKVLDGTESWTYRNTQSGYATFQLSTPFLYDLTGTPHIICSHFEDKGPVTAISIVYQMGIGIALFKSPDYPTGRNLYLNIPTSVATDITEFKQFLADQYQAGKPVVIVYPLAEPTTETVTAQPMNIQAGSNTVSIVQASMDDLELEVKYKAGVAVTITEIENAQLDDNVEVTING